MSHGKVTLSDEGWIKSRRPSGISGLRLIVYQSGSVPYSR